jgi:hypothetical protein
MTIPMVGSLGEWWWRTVVCVWWSLSELRCSKAWSWSLCLSCLPWSTASCCRCCYRAACVPAPNTLVLSCLWAARMCATLSLTFIWWSSPHLCILCLLLVMFSDGLNWLWTNTNLDHKPHSMMRNGNILLLESESTNI